MYNVFYRNVLALKAYLENEIAELEQKCRQYPEGELFVFKNGQGCKWRVRTETKMIYLPQDQKAKAYTYAQKKYDEARLQDLKYDLHEINQYLKTHKENPNIAAKLLSDPRYSPLLSQSTQQDWGAEPYEQCTFYPENKIHSAPSGIYVRSKSELMIATLLYLNNIPFRYEQALHLGKRTYYPDFTIRHPVTGEIYYWEHLGRMDDPAYLDNAHKKLYVYAQHQILLSTQLIVTTESKSVPLTTQKIQSTINAYFNTVEGRG